MSKDDSPPPKLNQLDVNYWKKRWDNNNFPWHETQVHKDILKVGQQMLFKPKCRIFLPLCGKAVDMRHLAELGHEVVGLDCSERAADDFFAEQKLECERSVSDCDPDFRIFKSTTLDIRIFVGDFFAATDKLLGRFDSIWDRGSLIAINPSDRVKYARIIKSIVTSDTRYFIQAVSYDQSKHAGPPFSLTDNHVKDLFGADFDIKVREEVENENTAKVFNTQQWTDKKYLLTPKPTRSSM